MDRRPTLETRPPVLIDAVVRRLIPARCREHVVGDLWERYRSPLGYTVDAMRTVPFVIVSQIRRTSTFSLVVVQAFALVVPFAVASGGIRRLIAPVCAGLLGLVLRDAYKSGLSLSVSQVARDVAIGLALAAISQLLIAAAWPDLLLPPRGVAAAIASFGMIFLLRLQSPGLANQPRQTLAAAPASLEALVTEVRLYERVTLRAVRIEMWAGVIVGFAFVIPMLSSPNWTLRVGWALTASYGLYVAYVISQKKPRRMPDGLGLKEALTFYRTALEGQHRAVRTMWRWYLLPIIPGMLFVMAGSTMAAVGRGRPAWPGAVSLAVVALIGVAVHFGALGATRKLRVRIDALKVAEEQ
jgi:hypothetical protein